MSSQFIMPAVPTTSAIRKEGESLVDRARDLCIRDEDSYVASWAMVQAHDAAIGRVSAVFDPFVSGLNKLHKMAVELRDGFIKPLVLSKTSLLDRRSMFRQEQERIKKDQDAKAALALQAQQKKDLEKLAKKEQKAGNVEAAETLREEAKNVPLPAMAPTAAVPKQAGAVIRERWTFEITDPDKVEREYCSPDATKIRKVVEALGDKAKISGIRIWKDTKEHSRSAK
jgi:peroxiredoxin family protein